MKLKVKDPWLEISFSKVAIVDISDKSHFNALTPPLNLIRNVTPVFKGLVL